VQYLYYETPVVRELDPPCGPVTGYTEIAVKGKNFMNLGFGLAKCVFNGTYYMNATIVNEERIDCSTPPLTLEQQSLPPQYMFYYVAVTLNGNENTEELMKFAYYPELIISSVEDADLGPVSGGTVSEVSGLGFTHPNVCNLKVRYGALEVTPNHVYNDTHIQTTSPEVNVPDAVVLAPSGNSQNYGYDWILHVRDEENTFTYY